MLITLATVMIDSRSKEHALRGPFGATCFRSNVGSSPNFPKSGQSRARELAVLRRPHDGSAAPPSRRWRLIASPAKHPVDDVVALDETMLEGGSNVEGDESADRKRPVEVPLENLIGQRLVFAEDRWKIEEAEKADGIAVGVCCYPAERRHGEQ